MTVSKIAEQSACIFKDLIQLSVAMMTLDNNSLGLQAMPEFFDLIGGNEISEEERWRMLDSLFDERPLLVATAAISMASLVGWQQGLTEWGTVWAISGYILLAGRVMLSRSYRARPLTDPIKRWKQRHVASSVLTGLQWGMGGIAFLLTSDSGVLCGVFAVESTILIGACARGCCFPSSTLLQTGIASLMILVFNALAHYWIMSGIMVLSVVYQVFFIGALGRVNLKQILSDQQRKLLLESLERTNAEIAIANSRLQEISMTDALTGSLNRRCFDLDMEASWTRAAKENQPLALLFIDVDHFKRFNDQHGHPAGDRCLSLVANAIDSVLRAKSDRAYRYGGEEFAVLLADTGFERACEVGQRIAAAVRTIAAPIALKEFATVTISVGVASIAPEPDMSSATLLSLADQAVYLAKKDGRDCVRSIPNAANNSAMYVEPVPLVPRAGSVPVAEPSMD